MVAAAAIVGDVSVKQAWALLLLVIAGITGTVALAGRISLHGLGPLPRSPEVLLDRTRQIVERLAPDAIVKDRAWGIEVDRGYLQALEAAPRDLHVRLRDDHPGALRFWYRSSPEPIVARTWEGTAPWEIGSKVVGRVTRTQPTPGSPGSIEVVLDPLGRLVRFARAGSEAHGWGLDLGGAATNTAASSQPPFDLGALFEQAGLDPSRLSSEPPDPGQPGERRVWVGTFGDTPSRTHRVIATLHGGRLGFFEVTPVDRASGAGLPADAPSPLPRDDLRLCIDPKATGAVRISFGLASNFADARAVVDFAVGFATGS
jgi:hypothetical protein